MDTHTTKRNFLLYGEAHPNARLTRAQVVEIREEAKVEGTSRAWLARRYGVSRSLTLHGKVDSIEEATLS